MPRQTQTTVDNNFRNGLITEATALNFPDNACTETFNCEFNANGSVSRRLGFDFEPSFQTKTIDRSNSAINSYLWKNVSGNGDVTVVVVQVGSTVYFYRLVEGATFSSGAVSSTVTLVPVAGAPDPATVEAQFSDGNGLLFITHPSCEPIRVSYNITTDVATPTNIIIKIRDFEGATADPFAVDERPISTFAGLNNSHLYNLLNQGWNAVNLAAWDTPQTTMPSNSDIMWRFKDASGNFDPSSTSIARITAGNTPAPKGHYVLTLSLQNRDGISGTVGVANTTTGSQRPSISAFFAGRVFYGGINFVGFNSTVYFTQIIERPEQYAFCYQANDPTSENLFDLLPSDGGAITIPDAGTIYKLVPLQGGLGVFAANGVWFISGSQGIGFTATDYTVQRVGLIPTLSATSFVNVAGWPAWWNAEGIYIIDPSGGQAFGQGSQLPAIKNITYSTIKDFYDAIPVNSKRLARGAYDRLNGRIRWIYRATDTVQITNLYEFDRILNFNVNTGAFYPWTITDSPVKVNSLVIADTIVGTVSTDIVTANAGADNVVDLSSNQVISFSSSGLERSPFDKYLVSYPDSGSYKFTFANKSSADYLDWFTFDFLGRSYDSHFITGYKIRGDAIRKFQSNWVRIFSETTLPVAYTFQGIWDYALTGSGTGRWSAQQHISHSNTDYFTNSARLKVRGHGKALQFRVGSVTGEPFEISGWSAYQSANAIP